MTGEAVVRDRLSAVGISSSTWSNGPGDRYADHRHGYDKVLVAASGSISFTLPEHERTVELGAGDRLDLPAGTVHGAVVGDRGVVCVEGHLDAGSLGPTPTLSPGWASLETATRHEA